MIIWISKELAIAAHDRQLAEHGGTTGVRDETLLESALARPQQLHAYGEPQPDLADLAASLAFGIARNPPFVDGNKRTAYVACRTFLVLNGADISADLASRYQAIMALAQGHLPESEFATWLRENIVLPDGTQVQEPSASYSKAG